MKNELGRFERIADGAYFAIDIRAFEYSITPYDPILANQTITNQETPGNDLADVDEAKPNLLNT
ncbi:MAG TPA: hypothetical protein VE135_21820 [Pyrinomonadaceae bacterium]|nr:hypothetical protein [Pyrinomonadaceae bacterium]